jgi:hypothetical protein
MDTLPCCVERFVKGKGWKNRALRKIWNFNVGAAASLLSHVPPVPRGTYWYPIRYLPSRLLPMLRIGVIGPCRPMISNLLLVTVSLHNRRRVDLSTF